MKVVATHRFPPAALLLFSFLAPLFAVSITPVNGDAGNHTATNHVSGEGQLRVQTVPAVPTVITIDGILSSDYGIPWTSVPAGSHNLTFTNVPGFLSPENYNLTFYGLVAGSRLIAASSVVPVYANTTTVVTLDFEQEGTLHVVTNPPTSGTVYVNGTALSLWGAWVSLAPGKYVVSFGNVSGLVAPSAQLVSLIAGKTILLRGNYSSGGSSNEQLGNLGLLRVETVPALRTTISVNGLPRGDFGLNWVPFRGGHYNLTFSDVPGFQSPGYYNVTIHGPAGNSELVPRGSTIPIYAGTVTVVTIEFSTVTPTYGAYVALTAAIIGMLSATLWALTHGAGVGRPRFSQTGRSKLLVVGLPFLMASIVFALLASSSPVKSLLPVPGCLTEPECTNYNLLRSFSTYQSYVEIAEGFAVVTLLLAIFALRAPDLEWLDRPLAARFPNWLLVPMALVGASVFGLLVAVDAIYEIFPFWTNLGNLLYSFLGDSFGVVALGAWSLTVFIMSLRYGIARAMKVFGFPAILFLMAMLLAFMPWIMTLYVTVFTEWSWGGIYLMSNWFILIVISSLALLSYAPLFPRNRRENPYETPLP